MINKALSVLISWKFGYCLHCYPTGNLLSVSHTKYTVPFSKLI